MSIPSSNPTYPVPLSMSSIGPYTTQHGNRTCSTGTMYNKFIHQCSKNTGGKNCQIKNDHQKYPQNSVSLKVKSIPTSDYRDYLIETSGGVNNKPPYVSMQD